MDNSAAPAIVAGEIVHALPQALNVGGVGADDRLLQSHRMCVRAPRFDDGANDGRHAVHFRDAGYAFVSVDENQTIVV